MAQRIAFLRAVNLGKRRVKMARVVELLDELGHPGAWTHVNSGNVVFDATGSRAALEAELETAFGAEFGFEVTTFVRTVAEVRSALALQPFRVGTGDTYFVTFLKDSLTAAKAKELEAKSNDFDTLVCKGRDVHWLMKGKSTDTRLATKDWEAVVGKLRSTSRNTTMLNGLLAKIDKRGR